MFPLGSTTVNCSSSADEAGNIGNGSFPVIVQDTNSPVIAPSADRYAETNSSLGAFVFYPTPTATDIVDGSVPVVCSPASRSRFPMGANLVTCTATDSNGNTATSYFTVFVEARERDTVSSSSGSPAFIIPLTGGQIMDLDCNSVFWAFGIKLSYLNLCDQQTSVHSVSADDLPGTLPVGFSYVMGLNVTVLTDGQILDELPNGTGLEIDFPLYKESADQFVVLYWNDSQGQWIKVSKEIGKNQISETLKTGSGDELYRLTSTDTAVFFPILTTNHTGIYVLAKK
jgi:hypothetical protein